LLLRGKEEEEEKRRPSAAEGQAPSKPRTAASCIRIGSEIESPLRTAGFL